MALGEAQKWEKQRFPCPPNLPSLREQNTAFLVILCIGERSPLWAAGLLLPLDPVLLTHITAHSSDCHPSLLSIPEGWSHKMSRQEKEH